MGERTRMCMCETEVFMKNQAMCEIFVVLLPDTGQLKEEKKRERNLLSKEIKIYMCEERR